MFLTILLFALFVSPAIGQATRQVEVVDEAAQPIAGARIRLLSASGVVLQQTVTDTRGLGRLVDLSAGRYELEVSAPSFQASRRAVALSRPETRPLRVTLTVGGFGSNVTVTAERSRVTDVERAAPVTSVREADDFRTRPLATIGNALEGAPGIMVQQSTYGQVSPFLRGLTGYQVLNLVDGVRFNNATFRSGPNQYLALVDASQSQRVETVLGPASAQFGSDALGGAIQVLTPTLHFAAAGGLQPRGTVNLAGGTADRSSAADAMVAMQAPSFTMLVGGSGRWLGDLRGGQGRDSRHVLRRLFGLSDERMADVTGTRQVDTGFSQSGVSAKATGRLGHQQNLTLWYQRSEMRDVRGYKDMWGGLGRVRSDFTPQGLDLFYARYEKIDVGPLDWLSGTFSLNAQRDGSIRQGLRATDTIVSDDVNVDALGYAVQAGAHAAERHAFVFGGEVYDEHVDAVRDETHPVTGAVAQQRALYPNGSTYRTTSVFAQDVIELVKGAERGGLTLNVGGRFTRIDVETVAAANVTAAGQPLGVVDSVQAHQDWTYNTSLTWQAATWLSLHGLVGRGFRAPNLNDLGALGLNDLGYEVPASATRDGGSLIGDSDGEGAVSTGARVETLSAERLFNYEAGASVRAGRLFVRANVFDAELKDPIVRRTMLFQADNVPASLAGVPVAPITPTTAQRAQGVVPVATAIDPRAVKSFINIGAAQYYGLDALASYRVSRQWFAEGNYSYLVGHDLAPTRAVRRLPPQQGTLSVRYQPGGRLPWLSLTALMSGAQEKLSGGDLTDERIGAARRRSDIADFFRGDLVRPHVNAGADGVPGTTDDVLGATGETLAQIQDRVLPIGATVNGVTIVDDSTRVPLFTSTPGFVSLNVAAGMALAKNLSLSVSVSNLLDRSYRVHGSGFDAPGVNLYARVNLRY